MEKNENGENIVRINVITLGASGVGKTSIIKRIKDGTFNDKIIATVGLDSFCIIRKYEKKNLSIYLNFHDTMGQEDFHGLLPPQYIRNSPIVLLVFSSIDTLNDLIIRWYKYYKDNTNIDNSKFILIGNKSDSFGDKRDEIVKKGEEFADEINALFMTCSAKSSDNMDNLERFILKEAKRFIDELEKKININNERTSKNKNINLNDKKEHKKKKGCKCK